ncbi:MAG: division plane positioning ATPase MipZ [Rhodospirillales bacterium]
MQSQTQTIVIGNEKGGSGKSTTAIHLAVGLMHAGLTVATVDLDGRQGTMTRFWASRRKHGENRRGPLLHPAHETFPPSDGGSPGQDAADVAELDDMIARLATNHDAIVIDTPGSDTALSRAAHVHADTLVTPLNDSYVDLDVIGIVDPDSMSVERPSHYAEMVWNQRKRRASRGLPSTDWIVMRNRLSNLDARAKREMARLLDDLAKRFRFRITDGFGERTIYRELFLHGLTILDAPRPGDDGQLSLSHLAARQEIRTLIETVRADVGNRPRARAAGQ